MSINLDNKLKDLFTPFVKSDLIHGMAVAVVDGEKSAYICLGHTSSSSEKPLNPSHYKD